MFDNIVNFFKKLLKENKKDSKDTAKERLHLVLMQDRANVSADFMELMKQEIIEVIKKYIDVDENSIDVKLTNKVNSDGTTGAPILYANIPILNVKDDTKQIHIERKLPKDQKEETKQEKVVKEEKKVESKKESEQNLEELKESNIEEKKEATESKKQETDLEKEVQIQEQAIQGEQQEEGPTFEIQQEEKEEVDQKQENSAEKNEEQKQEKDKNSEHAEV